MTQRNIKVTLSYDGTDFHGWQIQPNQPTIQGILANAIEHITQEKILPQGSGRTDAGVHAIAQVASFNTSSSVPLENLQKALNSQLPNSVRITRIEEAPPDFHARHCARFKTYLYRIYCGQVCPPFVARYVYHHPYPLVTEAMIKAAEKVVGKHDFTSFAAADAEKYQSTLPNSEEQNVRTIFTSEWEARGEELVYTIRGSGFLHHMVRNLVGTFLLVGRGTLAPEDIPRILAARNRSSAGATAPARGLFLLGAEY